jgi:hypothetical protein
VSRVAVDDHRTCSELTHPTAIEVNLTS